MSSRNHPHIDFSRTEGVLKEIVFTLVPDDGVTVTLDPDGYTLKLGDKTYTSPSSIIPTVQDNVLHIVVSIPANDHVVGNHKGWLRSNTLVDGSYWELTLNMTVNERYAQ